MQQEDSQVSTEQRRQASEHFLEQARAEFAAGDLGQASEKGWRAAAQMLKAIAEQRGWEQHRHRDYHRAASRIRAATGDREMRGLFDSASALDENFYENDMDADWVAESLDDVENLLAKLYPLLTSK